MCRKKSGGIGSRPMLESILARLRGILKEDDGVDKGSLWVIGPERLYGSIGVFGSTNLGDYLRLFGDLIPAFDPGHKVCTISPHLRACRNGVVPIEAPIGQWETVPLLECPLLCPPYPCPAKQRDSLSSLFAPAALLRSLPFCRSALLALLRR